MYVRGYLLGSENGRVVTIVIRRCNLKDRQYAQWQKKKLRKIVGHHCL